VRFSAAALLADMDAHGYDQLAANLLDEHGFSMSSASRFPYERFRVPARPLMSTIMAAGLANWMGFVRLKQA
jgi:hypothetical protein